MALMKADKIGGADKVFGVPASHGAGVHEVIRWRTGIWSCNCTDWIVRRAKSPDHREATGNHCKHIKRCIGGEFKPGGTVYLVPGRPTTGGRAAAPGADEEV